MEYNPNKTAAYLAGKIDEYVKQPARDTIVANVRRDRFARYARIPDGKACDFCKMLGSRGFVYHSEEKAGGKGNDYHPFCNCQIAVSFDPQMEFYYKNGVKVARGYASDATVASAGRDGSMALREVDADALYDEYIEAGKSYSSGSRYRDFSKRSKLTQQKLGDYMDELRNADSLEELYAAGDRIVSEWKPGANGRNQKQWDDLSSLARHREEELKSIAREGGLAIEVDEMVPCLRRLSDDAIVQTEVRQVSADELKKYKKSNGWFIDWADVPEGVKVYKVSVAGSLEPEGLIGILDAPHNNAVQVHWGVAAPHNQGLLVGRDNKVYSGVGGHLFAIAVDESMRLGYNGFIYGKAANRALLEYYVEEFGAVPFSRGYEFYIDEDAASKILSMYTWEKK